MAPPRAAGPRASLADLGSWARGGRADLLVREVLDERDWSDARGREIRRASEGVP